MRKILTLCSLVLVLSLSMAFELSVFGGMEIGGRNRPYIGARVGTLSSGISFMLEGYYPLSTFQELENINIEDIRFIEIDPYLYLGLPLGTSLLYVGVAPIFIFDLESFDFSLASVDSFHAKLGLRFGGGIILFAEGMTTITTSFETLGVYAISIGIGIGF